MQWDEIFSEVAIFFKFSRVIYKGVTLKKYIIKEKNWKIHEKRGKNCSPTLCPILSWLCLTPPPPLKSDIIYARSLRGWRNWWGRGGRVVWAQVTPPILLDQLTLYQPRGGGLIMFPSSPPDFHIFHHSCNNLRRNTDATYVLSKYILIT